MTGAKLPIWAKDKDGVYRVFPHEILMQFENGGRYYANFSEGCNCSTCKSTKAFLHCFDLVESGLYLLRE